MRQLISRIDDELHRDLKARAVAEGRSLNALVTDLLSSAVADETERSAVIRRATESGMRVVPGHPIRPPSRDAAIALTRGVGTLASEALTTERAQR